MQKPELLAPAGNLDILKIAFMYGADAVYCGTGAFAMRARVGFTLNSLKEGIEYAHKLNKKVYLTVNAITHSLDIAKLKKHVLELAKLHPDAFIIADAGLVQFALKNTKIPVHISTQANTTNQLTAKFWQDLGVERVVLARELSLKEIKKISQNVDIELEAFIHGAMCMAYSGRCQISNYMTGRDPNQGQCIQACRFKYKMYGLEEEMRKGEIFPIYEDEDGTHILNSKDLCMIKHVDKLTKAGVNSFKIEGRLKTEYYVATVIRAYRRAIDIYFSLLDHSKQKNCHSEPCLSGRQVAEESHHSVSAISKHNLKQYRQNLKELEAEIKKAANRGLTTGFYFKKPSQNTNNYKSSKAVSHWGYIGRVLDYDKKKKILKFEAKNYLPINSQLEILTPDDLYQYELKDMKIKNEPAIVAHANNIVEIPFDFEIPKDSLIRIKL